MAEPEKENLFPYTPSEALTLLAAGLFGVSAILHLVVMIGKRTWFYMALVVGSFMMTGGYVSRFLSAKSPDNIGLYIAQSILILLPPSLYAATIYMIYGRIVHYVNAPEASVIRPTRVTKIFVAGDVLAFQVQGAGGGLMGKAENADLGKKILLVGLFAQLLFFGFFLVIAIIFDRRMVKSAKLYSVPRHGKHGWRKLLMLLLVAAVIIIARCVYRMIEVGGGHDGYLMTHEWVMYVFDGAPMLVVQALFHFVHAGDVFGSGGAVKQEGLDEDYIALSGV
ncbi:RTA1 like protein-domain-containing protein [Ilyonectria destructans]|nr:RTA1 like protein-domain-containing protein [Ilyonectria destructans]